MKSYLVSFLVLFGNSCFVKNNTHSNFGIQTRVSNVVPNVQNEVVPITALNASINNPENVSENSHCPGDMVYVNGEYCPNVQQDCLQWDWPNGRNRPHGMRCFRFAPSICRSAHRVHMEFCMDRFEYPNRQGELPRVMITYTQSERLCRNIGKRLCTANEFDLACEGNPNNDQITAYTYGDERDSSACNIDRHDFIVPNRRLLGSFNPDIAMAEARRVYLAVPSGSFPRCKSGFGVFDLNGNVDEFNFNPHGSRVHPPYISNLKSGYWGFVRARCRPSTTAHGLSFSYYQIGTRCCSDVRN